MASEKRLELISFSCRRILPVSISSRSSRSKVHSLYRLDVSSPLLKNQGRRCISGSGSQGRKEALPHSDSSNPGSLRRQGRTGNRRGTQTADTRQMLSVLNQQSDGKKSVAHSVVAEPVVASPIAPGCIVQADETRTLLGRTRLSDAFDFRCRVHSYCGSGSRRGHWLPKSKAKSKASDKACPERSRRECPTDTLYSRSRRA